MDFELDPTAVKQVAPVRKRPPVPRPPSNPTLGLAPQMSLILNKETLRKKPIKGHIGDPG